METKRHYQSNNGEQAIVSLTLDGQLKLEGPRGSVATFTGDGEVATLEMDGISTARELLGSEVVRSLLRRAASQLRLLEYTGLTLKVKISGRTVFTTNGGSRASAVISGLLNRF